MKRNYSLRPNSSVKSFTLVELIIVVIIIGILAAVGLSQYSLVVEKARTTEARVRIAVMRNFTYQYYLENGLLTGMTNADVGVDNTCTSTDFYRYTIGGPGVWINLYAVRCDSGGKPPNASRGYDYYLSFCPSTGQSIWQCRYHDDGSPCFGLPA